MFCCIINLWKRRLREVGGGEPACKCHCLPNVPNVQGHSKRTLIPWLVFKILVGPLMLKIKHALRSMSSWSNAKKQHLPLAADSHLFLTLCASWSCRKMLSVKQWCNSVSLKKQPLRKQPQRFYIPQKWYITTSSVNILTNLHHPVAAIVRILGFKIN